MWFVWLIFLLALVIVIGGIVAGGLVALILIRIAVFAAIATLISLVLSGHSEATGEDVRDVRLATHGRARLTIRQLTRLRMKNQ